MTTTTTVPDLLPCPLCEGALVKAIEYAGRAQHEEDPRWWVGCTKCECGVDHVTRNGATAAWNTRPAANALATLRAEDGMVMVPRELTEAMLRAGWREDSKESVEDVDDVTRIWSAMIAASPVPPSVSGEE